MKVILLGPPGAGKGTQARMLASKLGVPQISTGDLLRAAREEKSVLGRQAEIYMNQGALVPDHLVVDLVKERIARCNLGYILDGFPRNLHQAESLNDRYQVVYLEVPFEELIRRLSGRRLCAKCGESYHLDSRAPRKQGVCDRCGGELLQRADDQEGVVRNRLEVYERETRPLIEHYKGLGTLTRVRGLGTIEEIFQNLLKVLDQ